jgi:hypothetical protein
MTMSGRIRPRTGESVGLIDEIYDWIKEEDSNSSKQNNLDNNDH